MNWSLKEATMLQVEKSQMVKCPGVSGWNANARPLRWENTPLLPGGMGTAGID